MVQCYYIQGSDDPEYGAGDAQGIRTDDGGLSDGHDYTNEANRELENKFKYHAPKPGQPEKYEAIREKAKELAYLIGELVPDSREKSLAMTKLEECSMWANAGIERNE